MTQRTTPDTNIQEISRKPKHVTDNYARLLRLLEANVARAREPELIRRLREQIRTILERSC
jgi:hypothetical protein